MKINNNTVIDRNARPGVLQPVALRIFTINDGSYSDLYAISSVSLFRLVHNTNPSSLVDVSNLIYKSLAISVKITNFQY